jgi:hypothetical protein
MQMKTLLVALAIAAGIGLVIGAYFWTSTPSPQLGRAPIGLGDDETPRRLPPPGAHPVHPIAHDGGPPRGPHPDRAGLRYSPPPP